MNKSKCKRALLFLLLLHAISFHRKKTAVPIKKRVAGVETETKTETETGKKLEAINKKINRESERASGDGEDGKWI